MRLDEAGIRALLPHGHPMLLVDRVDRLRAGESIEATKAVSTSEPCYRGVPVGAPADCYAYPVSLLVESFGQAAALLWLAGATPTGPDAVLFAVARDVRIDGAAHPGDVLTHRARLDRVGPAGAVFVTGETWVGQRRLVRFGSLMAVTRPGAAGAPSEEESA